MGLDATEFQTGLESVTAPYGRTLLFAYATNAGEPFLSTYHKHFPVATTANEQPKNTNIMNINLNITADPKVLEALNNLTSAISGGWKGTAGDRLEAILEEKASAPVVGGSTSEEVLAEAPKTRKKKETKVEEPKTEVAPEQVEPETKAEPEEEYDGPVGAELAAKVKPLAKTPLTGELKDYKASLGIPEEVTLSKLTDKKHLRLMNAKIDELLAKLEEGNGDEAV